MKWNDESVELKNRVYSYSCIIVAQKKRKASWENDQQSTITEFILN